jgi:pimeloyl-ACP methyl ester carboxylesterase
VGVGKALLVGHSFGCAPALAIALDDPDLAAGLVDVAGASHPWDGSLSIRYPLSYNPMTSWALRMAASLISEDKLVDPVFEPQATPAGYIEHLGVALALRPATFRHNAEDILRLNESLKRMAPRYPSLELPIEILHGSLDDVVKESISPRGVERDVPHSRFTLLDGIGHMPHHVAEDEILAAINRLAKDAFGETTK